MDLFPIIYLIVQFLLIVIIGITPPFKRQLLYNLMATLNMMLWFYGLYLIRILIGLVQFLRPIIQKVEMDQYDSTSYTEPILRMAGMVFLPFFFLIPSLRKSILFTILISMYTFWNFSPSYLNSFEILLKIFFCVSVFAATYAVLWLFQKHPSQTVTN